MDKILLLQLLFIFSFPTCLNDDVGLSSCKQIPNNWILLSSMEKKKWLLINENICKFDKFEISIPFLLDLVKSYSNRRKKDKSVNTLIYRNISRLQLNREYFVIMEKGLRIIKTDCNSKYSELDFYFILRTMFNSSSLRDIETIFYSSDLR